MLSYVLVEYLRDNALDVVGFSLRIGELKGLRETAIREVLVEFLGGGGKRTAEEFLHFQIFGE